MVLKGVNWVHNAKIRPYGLERSQTLALAHTSASTKEHYIISAKTYDAIDCKKFNEWLECVHRLSKVTGKALPDVAVATSSGSLYKYICELIGKL